MKNKPNQPRKSAKDAKPIYLIHPRIYYVCPMCRWRCNGRSGMRHHVKYQHQLGYNDIAFSNGREGKRSRNKLPMETAV